MRTNRALGGVLAHVGFDRSTHVLTRATQGSRKTLRHKKPTASVLNTRKNPVSWAVDFMASHLASRSSTVSSLVCRSQQASSDHLRHQPPTMEMRWMQCATFTGIRPVFAKNLIILEWYGMWYVKSGIVKLDLNFLTFLHHNQSSTDLMSKSVHSDRILSQNR